ncbi:unnamed protein product [Pipistrellus nathusii]|uniref:Uncharacterized protein n=1 Tax=Pipistrellus nathusii TaxID=59473 RepID=A0ABN9ZZ47_PIPNA
MPPPLQKWLLAGAQGYERRNRWAGKTHPFLRDRYPYLPPIQLHGSRAQWGSPSLHPHDHNPLCIPSSSCHRSVLLCLRAACHDGAFSLCLPIPGLSRILTAKNDQKHGD